MARVCVLVLFLWCSLDPNLVTKVSANTSISLSTSIIEPTEGETAELQCNVDHTKQFVIEWRRIVTKSEVTLARNGTSLDPKFKIQTLISEPTTKSEILNIVNITNDDAAEYICQVTDLMGSRVHSTSRYISVMYFPPEPTCFPHGPITVQEGDTLAMNFTTERGNPAVSITRSARIGTGYQWTHLDSMGEQTQSLQLVIRAVDDGNSFKFQITSSLEAFLGMSRSCTIGPINVVSMTTPPMTTYSNKATMEPTADLPSCYLCATQCTGTTEGTAVLSASFHILWTSAFLVSVGLLIISLITNMFFALSHRRQKKSKQLQAEPYIEMKQLGDGNRNDVETIDEQSNQTQHTYDHLTRLDNTPKYDVPRTNPDSSNTTYEAVGEDQEVEKRYQNVKY